MTRRGTSEMDHYQKSSAELWRDFREQLEALESSSRAFDAGSQWEAKRLATIAYVLLHDGGRNSRSLLTQVGLKETLRFPSTRLGWSDASLTTQMPLVLTRADHDGAKYLPLLDDGPPTDPQMLSFSRWWEQPVLRDTARRTLSRKNLIFSLRNQDGGSHSDGELTDAAYAAISRQNGAGWFIERGNERKAIDPGPHLATMRQIAQEIKRTLHGVVEAKRPHTDTQPAS
jgi:hypothetical protein